MSESEVLAARGLEVRYAGAPAVRGLNLSVHDGEVVGLIGPDGAGKTSTLRVLAGLQRASAGEAVALGMPCWAKRRVLHRKLGYLAQRFALYGDLTVNENVRFFATLYGVEGWRRKRAALLERVGLERFTDRLADRLSGGMKQKLALACTLIHSPVALLLDEPTTGVDPVTRREFWRLLAELVAEGLTLLVATPYLDEAERCTRVVLMDRGVVLTDAPPTEIPMLVPGRVVKVTAAPRTAVAEVLAAIPEVVDLATFGAGMHARVEGSDEPIVLIRRALDVQGVEVEDLREIRTGLEDAFLYLTRQKTLLEEAS